MVFHSSAVISLHAGSVESDIPVGKVLQEDKDLPDNSVESIVVEFIATIFDQVLVGSDDPLAHVVRGFRRRDVIAHLRVVDEVSSGSLLVTSDVLDEETVGVEPREEDVLDDISDTDR